MLSVECVHRGCRFNSTQQQIQILINENTALRKQVNEMAAAHMDTRGYALWCTPGGHPFSDADKKRKPVTTLDDDGNEVTVMMCGDHLPDYMKPNAKRKVSLKALMAQMDDPDVEVTE